MSCCDRFAAHQVDAAGVYVNDRWGNCGTDGVNTVEGLRNGPWLSRTGAREIRFHAQGTVRQLRHHFGTISEGCLGSSPPRTRRVLCSAWSPCLLDANWCLRSDVMTDPRPQASTYSSTPCEDAGLLPVQGLRHHFGPFPTHFAALGPTPPHTRRAPGSPSCPCQRVWGC